MAFSSFTYKKIAKILASKKVYLVRSLNFRKKPHPLPVNSDYVRYATLGLCYEEIMLNNVTGNLAELGVYKGEFAKRLNFLFPDRKLYLFDTFQGFEKKDVETEVAAGFSTGEQNFSDTSVDLVLSKMVNAANCIVKKGFFPDTANGIEDRFCFVSLDADVYEPIYAGLSFFYPRLEKGGYIFVHDFNNDGYNGVRKAVVDFCFQNRIGYVPVPDSGGTVIITK